MLPARPTLCTYILSAVRLTGFGMDPAKYLRLRAAFNAPTADRKPRVGQVRRVPTLEAHAPASHNWWP